MTVNSMLQSLPSNYFKDLRFTMMVLEIVTYPIVSLVISTYIWEGSYLTPTHQHAHSSGLVQTKFNWIKTQKKSCRQGPWWVSSTPFPFVYQFNSRIGILVHSSFANDQIKRISTTFQHHFRICLLVFLHRKEHTVWTVNDFFS